MSAIAQTNGIAPPERFSERIVEKPVFMQAPSPRIKMNFTELQKSIDQGLGKVVDQIAGQKNVQAFSNTGITTTQMKNLLNSVTQIFNHAKVSTATNTKVSVGIASTSVRPSNANRLTLILVNDSDTTIYISKSATAVINEGIRINANGGSVIITDYTGAVAAITSAASKNLTVCET